MLSSSQHSSGYLAAVMLLNGRIIQRVHGAYRLNHLIKRPAQLLDVNVPFSGGGVPAYLEIDKLAGGRYRATVGTLFEFQELCRTGDLEVLLRQTRAVQTAYATMKGFEVMRMIRKRQCVLVEPGITGAYRVKSPYRACM